MVDLSVRLCEGEMSRTGKLIELIEVEAGTGPFDRSEVS